MINLAVAFGAWKVEVLKKLREKWIKRGEYQEGEEYAMYFFDLPTAMLLAAISMIPVLHLVFLWRLGQTDGRIWLMNKIYEYCELEVEDP